MARNIWKADRYKRRDGLGYDYPELGIWRKEVKGVLEAKSKSGTGYKVNGQWYNVSKYAKDYDIKDAEWGDYVSLLLDDRDFVRSVAVLKKWHELKSRK